MTQLHFLDIDIVSVTTRKMQSYTRMKWLLGKVGLNYLHQIIVNLLA